jgi:hypothetical protein
VSFTRIVMFIGIVFVGTFLAAVFLANEHSYSSGYNPFIILILVAGALGVLIAAGNMTYGKDSHYARAWERIRPARSVRTPPATEPTSTTTTPDPTDDAPPQ